MRASLCSEPTVYPDQRRFPVELDCQDQRNAVLCLIRSVSLAGSNSKCILYCSYIKYLRQVKGQSVCDEAERPASGALACGRRLHAVVS